MELNDLRQLTPELQRIAQKYGISRIYVFGSTARGESTPKSDVDFLVDLDPDKSLFAVAGFAYEAQKLLGVPVDVIPSSILAHLRDQDFVRHVRKDSVAL